MNAINFAKSAAKSAAYGTVNAFVASRTGMTPTDVKAAAGAVKDAAGVLFPTRAVAANFAKNTAASAAVAGVAAHTGATPHDILPALNKLVATIRSKIGR